MFYIKNQSIEFQSNQNLKWKTNMKILYASLLLGLVACSESVEPSSDENNSSSSNVDTMSQNQDSNANEHISSNTEIRPSQGQFSSFENHSSSSQIKISSSIERQMSSSAKEEMGKLKLDGVEVEAQFICNKVVNTHRNGMVHLGPPYVSIQTDRDFEGTFTFDVQKDPSCVVVISDSGDSWNSVLPQVNGTCTVEIVGDTKVFNASVNIYSNDETLAPIKVEASRVCPLDI